MALIVKYYQTVYPVQLLPRETEPVGKFIDECEQIAKRGAVSIPDLISGKITRQNTVGVGPVLRATEEMLRCNAEKYTPDKTPLRDSGSAQTCMKRPAPTSPRPATS